MSTAAEREQIRDLLAMGERKSQWGLARLSASGRTELNALLRRAYHRGKNLPTDPELCEEIALTFDSRAAVARRCAELAREENSL